MHIVLYQPEIPPNTGAIARTCAATKSPLHLIYPLGFKIDDKHLKRAGLDYWGLVEIILHSSWQNFLDRYGRRRLFFFSKRATQSYTKARYQEGDFLVFGPETSGLPQKIIDANHKMAYTIPMMERRVRSLNLASATSIVLYEALRQLGKV